MLPINLCFCALGNVFPCSNFENFVTWDIQLNVDSISPVTVDHRSNKELMNYVVFHFLLLLIRLHLMVTVVY